MAKFAIAKDVSMGMVIEVEATSEQEAREKLQRAWDRKL